MKLTFLFALIDLLILLAYPLAFIANQVQKLTGLKHSRRHG
jgi:hypothetical protein